MKKRPTTNVIEVSLHFINFIFIDNMRYALLFITLSVSFLTFGQKKSDYDLMMYQFKKFYNNWQPDSIRNIVSDKWRFVTTTKEQQWTTYNMQYWHKTNGDIKYVKNLGKIKEDSATLFRVAYTNKTIGIGITLDKDNCIEKLWTVEERFIDSLLKKR